MNDWIRADLVLFRLSQEAESQPQQNSNNADYYNIDESSKNINNTKYEERE